MYLTFNEFTDYGGRLSETEFNRFCFKAEAELNRLTFNRLLLKFPNETIKRCIFDLIEYISANNVNGETNAIKSMSNDGYSISYDNSKNAEQSIYGIILTYFGNTDFIYCGIDGTNDIEPIPVGYEPLFDEDNELMCVEDNEPLFVRS